MRWLEQAVGHMEEAVITSQGACGSKRGGGRAGGIPVPYGSPSWGLGDSQHPGQRQQTPPQLQTQGLRVWGWKEAWATVTTSVPVAQATAPSPGRVRVQEA